MWQFIVGVLINEAFRMCGGRALSRFDLLINEGNKGKIGVLCIISISVGMDCY